MNLSKRHQMRVGQPADVKEAFSPLPYLHPEIIQEILIRLPVKSLYKFRCVCKSWKSLISNDPLFTKLHLGQTLQNDQRKRLIFSSQYHPLLKYESFWTQKTVTLSSATFDSDNCCDGVIEAGELGLPLIMGPRNRMEIIGSSNGLLCLAPDNYTFVLVNPSTGDTKPIPDLYQESTSLVDCCAPGELNVYGFGYDPAADDYKVLRMVFGFFAAVYSLRSNSWRLIGVFPYSFGVCESGTLLRGALHWLVRNGDEKDDRYELVIAAFDLTTERFWHMPAPYFNDEVAAGFDFSVADLKGCLCVLHYGNQMQNDFWVMKKYGIGESWIKHSFSFSYMYMKPLCPFRSTKVLLEVDENLVVYDLEKEEHKLLMVCGVPPGFGFKAYSCEDSLISPHIHY